MKECIKTSLVALTAVSPMVDGDGQKDQDRAVWYPRRQIGCVADGTTSSPYAQLGAEATTLCSLAMFCGDLRERLRFVCDLLEGLREERAAVPVEIPSGVSESMGEMLRQTAREKLQSSFQTAMIAAQFEPTTDAIRASVVRCGDCMFAAFDEEGRPLACSPQSLPLSAGEDDLTASGTEDRGSFVFGPGDEVLVSVESDLLDRPVLAECLSVDPPHRHNWWLCRVLHKRPSAEEQAGDSVPSRRLACGDWIVAPSYLMGRAPGANRRQYAIVPYSRLIRTPAGPIVSPQLHRGGAVTAVLPDHFACGRWSRFSEVFPSGSQFVLCSDGFYSCFAGLTELSQWLKGNQHALLDPDTRPVVLEGLHEELRRRGHDDDISFVWVRPEQGQQIACNQEATDCEGGVGYGGR